MELIFGIYFIIEPIALAYGSYNTDIKKILELPTNRVYLFIYLAGYFSDIERAIGVVIKQTQKLYSRLRSKQLFKHINTPSLKNTVFYLYFSG
jgi:hypothetical protein